MSKKRVGLSLSLFPFLAVLICTMGVLVALLLLVVKQAEQTSTQEQSAAIAAAVQEQSELEVLRTEVEFRSQLLESQRERRQQELKNQRELLGHLESEMAQLRAQSQEVAEQILAFQATIRSVGDLSIAERTVAEQQRQLERLREQLEIAKRDQQSKLAANRRAAQPMYSIVPIAAQSGTNRRPIYIECREDGMYLFPGGIQLTLDDFVLPMTPGNPLDTALLAYREYWRKSQSTQAKEENAYPLLVVRPSGAKWYSVARRAMSGWDQEFGYELIPEDWQVNFGTAEPALVTHVNQAIDAARHRQQALVAYGQARPASQVNAVQPASGVTGSGNALIPATGGGFSAAPAQAGRQRNGAFDSALSSSGNGPDPIASFSSQFQAVRPAGGTASGSDLGESTSKEQDAFFSSSRQTPNPPSFGATGSLGGGSNTANSPGDRSPNAREQSARNGEAKGGVGGASSARNSQPMPNVAGTGSAGLPSTALPTMGQMSEANQATSEQKLPTLPPNPSPAWNRDSIAHERGADWALPSRRNTVSAYHRPVIVQVNADALVLPPGEGSPKSQTIPLGNTLSEAVDPLANAVWQRVDKWGYLGFDGYWKPVLELRYAPEQAPQAAALQRLFEGSGLEVKLPEQPSREGRP